MRYGYDAASPKLILILIPMTPQIDACTLVCNVLCPVCGTALHCTLLFRGSSIGERQALQWRRCGEEEKEAEERS